MKLPLAGGPQDGAFVPARAVGIGEFRFIDRLSRVWKIPGEGRALYRQAAGEWAYAEHLFCSCAGCLAFVTKDKASCPLCGHGLVPARA